MNTLKLLTKKTLLILFITTLMGCEKDKDKDIAPDQLTESWEVLYFQDLKTSAITKKEDLDIPDVFLENDISITFEETGTFFGQTQSNSFNGEYRTDNGSIDIPLIASTFAAETLWGDLFFEAITKSETYQIKSNRLSIVYNQGNNKMVLEKK